MKRAAFLAVLFLATLAQAQSYFPLSPVIEYSTTQALTQAVPTASTDGVSLIGGLNYRVSLCGVGGNLQAAGKLLAYVYSSTQAAWMHNPDQDLSVSVTGEVCQAWSGITVDVGVGRVKYVLSAVTLSAGTTAKVLIQEMVR